MILFSGLKNYENQPINRGKPWKVYSFSILESTVARKRKNVRELFFFYVEWGNICRQIIVPRKVTY